MEDMKELRRLFDNNAGIADDIREWLHFSDSEFACEQIDELRGVIRFDADAWDNVWALPDVDYYACGELADAVRNSIYSYPAVIEDDLKKLERYAAGVDRLGIYDIPEHFINAIEETMQRICDVYAECIHADFSAWLYYEDDELFEYFADDPSMWLDKYSEDQSREGNDIEAAA